MQVTSNHMSLLFLGKLYENIEKLCRMSNVLFMPSNSF